MIGLKDEQQAINNPPKTTLYFNLRSSEFVIFTNKPLPKPESGIVQEDFVTAIPVDNISSEIFKLYPVPAGKELFIELPIEMSEGNYRILDMTGRVLNEGNLGFGTKILELDVRDIKTGIYIFEAFDTKRVLRKRFIKN